MKRFLSLVAVLVIACGQASVSPSAVVGPSETPPPGASSIPATPSSASLSGSALRFEQVSLLTGLELEAVTAINDGFVAVGCRTTEPDPSGAGCSNAVALTSEDGRSWTEAAVEDGSGAQMHAIAETPLGLLAVGRSAVNEPVPTIVGAVWRSSDGRRWERMDVPDASGRTFLGVAALGERTVLVAGKSFVDGPLAFGLEAWATIDGRSWIKNEAVDNVTFTQLVAAHPGLVALGSDCVETCGPLPDVFVWRSVAGLGWSPDAMATVFEGAAIHRIVPWGGGLVGTGTVGVAENLRAAVWFDANGEWQRLELPGGSGLQPSEIRATEEGLLVVASAAQVEPAEVRAWSSPDGRTWAPLAVDGLTAHDVRLAGRGDVVVALADRSTIWVSTSPSGARVAERPAPQPSPVGPDGCLMSDPVSLRDILLLDPADRVRCLGGREIAFAAWVTPREGLGGTCPARFPEWLAACDAPLELRPEPGPLDHIFPVFIDPERSISLDLGGRRVDVRGHFDDPRAAGCRSEEAADDLEAIRGQDLVRRCREAFVVTDLMAVEG